MNGSEPSHIAALLPPSHRLQGAYAVVVATTILLSAYSGLSGLLDERRG